MITERCNALQEQAFEDAGKLLNSLRWDRSRNSNTMKYGKNPETHDVSDELRSLPPMKIKEGVSAWAQIMSAPQD